MKKQLFLFLMGIALILVIGCASEDDKSVVSSSPPADEIPKDGPITAVVEIFPPDASTDVPLNTSISVTFNQAVEPVGITAKTTGIDCYGEIQVSKDDFSTCLDFVTPPTPSNENTIYTVKPFSNLDEFTAYKLKIRYQYGYDNQDNPLTREQTSGFTTADTILSVDPGYEISAISGNTSEDGAQASFNIVLLSQPTAEVTLPISSSDTTEGTVAITELIFDTVNWNITQTVTVTGVDDSDFDGSQDYSIVLGVASSSDNAYDGQEPADVSLTNSENEVLQITSFQFLVANNTELTSDALVYISQTDKNITAFVPVGTVVTALVPTFTINAGSVTPLSEAAQDFTSPINYTVALSGLSTGGYTISVKEPVAPPDTQQTLCYDESGVLIDPCPAANTAMAQDGSYQTDPNPRFTAGSGATAGTVTDNQTGLVWEQGSSATTETPAYTWADAPSYCAGLNSASLGGYSNWRLPRKTELSWIVRNEGIQPFINSLFSGTASLYYWTSTPDASDPSRAWWVGFGNTGFVTRSDKTAPYYVRCCVHPNLGQAQNTIFVDNGDQTISDRKTGLMWQKCSYGQSGDDCSGGSATQTTWTEALSYCETEIGTSGTFAGHSDWRLPNRNELDSLTTAPAIDIAKFSNTVVAYYWTSTWGDDGDRWSARIVVLYTGQINKLNKTSSRYARCVR